MLRQSGRQERIQTLGALWRLNELELLPKMARFSGVSRGSITAAFSVIGGIGFRFSTTEPHSSTSEIVMAILATDSARVARSNRWARIWG
jgi:hypothetical protein